MKFINDINAIKKIRNIRNGKNEKISISQITGLITNMLDAKINLSRDEYDKVYKLYVELRKCTTKIEMDQDTLYKTIIDVINKFDSVAPYEKYSGGNKTEIGFLINDIHDSNNNKIITIANMMHTEMFLKYMVDNSKGTINMEIGKEFLEIVYKNSSNIEKLLDEFDTFANILIKEQPIFALSSISFLISVLKTNNLIDEHKMDELSTYYQNLIINKLKN